MLADDDVSASLNSWQALEEEMLRVYQNDARLLQEVPNLESIQEDVENEFRVESTGALLTAESAWRTERAARKEAAFQAYVALHEAGLVNDNLLPLNREGTVVRDEREELPSIMEVSEQLNPWVSLAKAWAFPELN
ncbi:hypothetical protein ACEPPN_016125 [Leptodophora sp. 'Broadleaf-Isolate-01']